MVFGEVFCCAVCDEPGVRVAGVNLCADQAVLGSNPALLQQREMMGGAAAERILTCFSMRFKKF